MSVNIIVFLKQVPDPEGSPSSYIINPAEKRVEGRGIPPVINPFDECALELALRIKDERGANITLISAGKNISRPLVLKALAAGADSAILIEDPSLESFSLDSFTTARILKAAVMRVPGFDLILCGIQSSDTNAGLVGPLTAGLLGIPCVTLARAIKYENKTLRVERVVSNAYETVICPAPALVTVTGEAGELRYPSLQAIRAAKELPQMVAKVSDLVEGELSRHAIELVSISAPERERRCRIIEGDTGEEAGKRLADVLREDGIL